LAYEWFVKGIPPADALSRSRELYIYVTVSTALVFTLFGLAHGLVMRKLSSIVFELAHTKNALEHVARSDMLTGLPNNKAFAEVAGLFVGHANRRQERLAVIVVGVEHLRQIANSHGQPGAESHIRRVAALLGEDLRQEDFVARLGAREFGVLLPGTSASEAELVANRLASLAWQAPSAKEPALALKFGITELGALDELRSLVGRAEAALQQARRLKDINLLTLAPLRSAVHATATPETAGQ
jgi:diguanylate cyclase (GGDEF)-like protein